MGYDVRDFEKDVMERSRTVPVLVDFWAPWCGPCKMLGPVLERLAAEAGGRWELIKVNTEENQDLAMAFDIRSIPAVKLFSGGDVVNEFTGALPEAEIRRWLAKALPSPSAGQLEEARRLLAEGGRVRAAEILENIVAAESGHLEARVLLAEALLPSAPDRTVALLSGVDDASEFAAKAGALRVLAVIVGKGDQPDAWPAAPVRQRFCEAVHGLKAGDFGAAVAAFIEVLQRNKAYADGVSKDACKAIFQLLGIRHPVVEQHHRAYTSALYS
jgi:putative thioredoxin